MAWEQSWALKGAGSDVFAVPVMTAAQALGLKTHEIGTFKGFEVSYRQN
jgi:hypothetical protein